MVKNKKTQEGTLKKQESQTHEIAMRKQIIIR